MVLQTSQLEQKARQLLGDRGVSVVDIANLVMHLQKNIYLI